ncbi:MAG: TetR/AcrR family transcriptional regulator [Sandaracinaceae bacterium]
MEASLQLFTGRDDDEVSIRSIAERAGVGVGSLYQYFKTREGVLDALVDRITADNFEAFRRTLEEREDRPLEDVLDAIVEGVIDIYLRRPTLTRVAVRTIIGFRRLDAITRERDRFVGLLTDRLSRELPHRDRDELSGAATIVTDMAMGAIVSQTFRADDPARVEQIRDAARRLARAELARLRAPRE